MTLSTSSPHTRCPQCGIRKRIRTGRKVCYMCKPKPKVKRGKGRKGDKKVTEKAADGVQ